MSTYRVLLTRETSTGQILAAFEPYRGPSLAEAVRVRGLAAAVLELHFGQPGEAPRPALCVRVLAPTDRGDFALAAWVLPEVVEPCFDDPSVRPGVLEPVTVEAP